jgi:hypothetical protein
MRTNLSFSKLYPCPLYKSRATLDTLSVPETPRIGA